MKRNSPRGALSLLSAFILYFFLFVIPVTAAGQATFSPAAGTYSGTQTVAINCPAGLTCFYTTDGSTPSIAGYEYTSPLTVSSSQTLKVIAVQVGVTARSTELTSSGWKCNTPTAGTYGSVTCSASGGVGTNNPSSLAWTFGSPMQETVSTTQSAGETQVLFIHTTNTTACEDCTEIVEDKIVQPNQGPTFVANQEMDAPVNMLATYNQFHSASLQCNQQAGNPIGDGTVAGPQWQYDNQQGSWNNFNPSITYGCPLTTTQQTEIRFGIHWTNGDTSCSGYSCDSYDFLTVCIGGVNGTGGSCHDFTPGAILPGYTEPTFSQFMAVQDQIDMTNTATCGTSPCTASRSVSNNNVTLAYHGTEATSSAAYVITGGTSSTSTNMFGQSSVIGQSSLQ